MHFRAIETGPWFQEEYSNDHFHFMEINARFQIKERLYASARLPYRFSVLKENEGISRFNGVADASVSVIYKVLDNRNRFGKKWSHQVFLGVGLEMPTGHFEKDFDFRAINAYMGSGSWDIPLNLIYQAQNENMAGLQLAASYQVNQTNHAGYKYGNALSADAMAFRSFDLKKFKFSPFVGLSLLYDGKDRPKAEFDYTSSLTGGYFLMGKSRLELMNMKHGLSCSFSVPIVQDYAMQRVRSPMQFSMAYRYFLGS